MKESVLDTEGDVQLLFVKAVEEVDRLGEHSLPTTLTLDLVRWAFISWVFGHATVFKRVIGIAEHENAMRLTRDMFPVYPIPDCISGMLMMFDPFVQAAVCRDEVSCVDHTNRSHRSRRPAATSHHWHTQRYMRATWAEELNVVFYWRTGLLPVVRTAVTHQVGCLKRMVGETGIPPVDHQFWTNTCGDSTPYNYEENGIV